MPRKKAESDDESTSVKRRTRTKSQAVEETAADAQAAPAEAADGEETQVKKKRSYARKPAAAEGEEIVIAGAPGQIRAAAEGTPVTATLGGREVKLLLDITPRQRDILLAGGLLNYIRDGGV